MVSALLLAFAVGISEDQGDGPPVLTTVAGTGRAGYGGDNGPATAALLNNPFDVAYDPSGNLVFSDTFNHRIRRIDARTGVVTTVAGVGLKGFGGDGGPATEARMNEPYGVVLDGSGHLYFADRLNRRVRRVDGKTGRISTVLGDGVNASRGDGGPAEAASLVEPNGVALDRSAATLYVADVGANRVRAVDLRTGVVRTFAGTGKARHSGDGGAARDAEIFGARAVEVSADGVVYVLERQGNTLRAVDPKTGVIRTIAGTGAKGASGDGGPALAATFNGPKELCLDRLGNVLIVDTENHLIRRVDVRTGVVTTVAGRVRPGSPADGPATRPDELARPHGVAVAPDGTVVIGDTENHRIRSVKGTDN